MHKKFIITVLTLLIIFILAFTVHIQLVDASIVTFNMDSLPENEGWTVYKQANVTSFVSNGILTVENNGGKLLFCS